MRNMSFALTEEQVMSDEPDAKDVTRRLGWEFLKPGDLVQAVRKSQGIPKGGKVHKLRVLRIKSVRREPLDEITPHDVVREGFQNLNKWQFVDMFCEANNCNPNEIITRIEFERVSE